MHNEEGQTATQVATDFIGQVLEFLDMDAEVFVEETDEEVLVTVEGDDIGLLIGRHGETLDALQHLAFLRLCRDFEERKRLVLDANGYRERRYDTLVKQADSAAAEAIESGRAVALDPMSSSERRVVHQYLADRGDVDTFSEGDEPYRYLVVEPL